jgi:hypothetical protein
MLGHSDYYAIRDYLKKSGKRLELLNRKSSSWEIESKETVLPPAKSVNPESLPSLIRDFDLLMSKGTTESVILKTLSKYWTARPLNNFAQLVNYVERYRPTVEIPELKPTDFDRAIKEDQSAVTKEERDEPTEFPVGEEKSYQELLDMTKFLEEYNSECNGKLKRAESDLLALRAEITELRKQNTELTGEVLKSKQSLGIGGTTSLVDLPNLANSKSAAVAIKTLVELRVLSPEEGLEKIIKSILMVEV